MNSGSSASVSSTSTQLLVSLSLFRYFRFLGLSSPIETFSFSGSVLVWLRVGCFDARCRPRVPLFTVCCPTSAVSGGIEYLPSSVSESADVTRGCTMESVRGPSRRRFEACRICLTGEDRPRGDLATKWWVRIRSIRFIVRS